jgi:hypothetical protein
MGLQSTLRKAAQATIKAMGDVAETVTYTSKGAPSYSPILGTTTSTDTDYTLNMIVEAKGMNPLETSVTQNIHSSALILTFAKSDLSVDPKTGDTITRSNGDVLIINGVKPDPATATYMLQASRPS